ncbi:hypothetical protein P152DRAFT_196250 [Eremomyces bilateralis CBS 781.70]|uniref:Uncharacterized protein n=1 Tax=Eremomyces bilateralis CBS 781.70 TaxID=1392243 RepID=A0A6G1GCL1_9PEZI|nr:uncharacterized protein P152DRAFT_196250 [Eremomyces bilateralis CBS 781.70]KAF1815773.1 hypothetical protein P152DRAFT_196250 [Eremomyces bilateralis CBS 781.70]
MILNFPVPLPMGTDMTHHQPIPVSSSPRRWRLIARPESLASFLLLTISFTLSIICLLSGYKPGFGVELDLITVRTPGSMVQMRIDSSQSFSSTPSRWPVLGPPLPSQAKTPPSKFPSAF